jgi:hypothetical protein
MPEYYHTMCIRTNLNLCGRYMTATLSQPWISTTYLKRPRCVAASNELEVRYWGQLPNFTLFATVTQFVNGTEISRTFFASWGTGVGSR